MAIFQPTFSDVNIPYQMPAYKSQYRPNSQIGQLLRKYGGTLAPMTQFSQELPYEQFAAPQRATLDVWEKTFARPEFERFTLNPFKRNYSNMAATSGMSQMGSAPRQYQTALAQTEQPYYNQLEQARNAMEDQIRRMYERRMAQHYDSPTAFNKIGKKNTVSQPKTRNLFGYAAGQLKKFPVQNQAKILSNYF